MGRSCSGTRAVKFRQHHRPDVRHAVGREDHGPHEPAPGTELASPDPPLPRQLSQTKADPICSS